MSEDAVNMHCSTVSTQTATTLEALAGSRPLVVEFWTTKCVRCPAALAAMDELAARGEDPLAVEEAGVRPLVAACALATSEDAAAELGKVRTLLGEEDGGEDGGASQFPHLTHLFMSFAQKEAAKARFGFTQVPHCVVRTAAHEVVSGPPHGAEVQRALAELGLGR